MVLVLTYQEIGLAISFTESTEDAIRKPSKSDFVSANFKPGTGCRFPPGGAGFLEKSDTVNITQFSHTPDRLHHICTHPEYQSDYLFD